MTYEVRMTIDERRKYLRIMQSRYQAATREAQGQLLSEMAQVTGLHRKSLIRLLGGDLQRHARTHERQCKYDPEVEAALAVIVEAVDYVCGERVHGSLLETIASLEHHGELQLTPEVRAKLTQISLSSLRLGRRMRRGTLPGRNATARRVGNSNCRRGASRGIPPRPGIWKSTWGIIVAPRPAASMGIPCSVLMSVPAGGPGARSWGAAMW